MDPPRIKIGISINIKIYLPILYFTYVNALRNFTLYSRSDKGKVKEFYCQVGTSIVDFFSHIHAYLHNVVFVTVYTDIRHNTLLSISNDKLTKPNICKPFNISFFMLICYCTSTQLVVCIVCIGISTFLTCKNMTYITLYL